MAVACTPSSVRATQRCSARLVPCKQLSRLRDNPRRVHISSNPNQYLRSSVAHFVCTRSTVNFATRRGRACNLQAMLESCHLFEANVNPQVLQLQISFLFHFGCSKFPRLALCSPLRELINLLCNMLGNMLNDLAEAIRRWTEKKRLALCSSTSIRSCRSSAHVAERMEIQQFEFDCKPPEVARSDSRGGCPRGPHCRTRTVAKRFSDSRA